MHDGRRNEPSAMLLKSALHMATSALYAIFSFAFDARDVALVTSVTGRADATRTGVAAVMKV